MYDSTDYRVKYFNLSEQLDKLAGFIVDNIDGEPSDDFGAVECAIHIMKKQKAEIDKLSKEKHQWKAKAFHLSSIYCHDL